MKLQACINKKIKENKQMRLKEKLTILMEENNIATQSDLLRRIYEELDEKDVDGTVKKQKSNFSQMLEGNRTLNKEYYIPLEKIFDIRIAELLDDSKELKYQYVNKGIRWAAASDDVEEFRRLCNEDNPTFYQKVIKSKDEFGKDIIDYIIEFKAINGFKYLINNQKLKYSTAFGGYNLNFSNITNYFSVTIKKLLELSKMLLENGDIQTFNTFFNTYQLLCDFGSFPNNVYLDKDFLNGIIENEEIFNSMFSCKELTLNEANHTKKMENETFLYINPILNNLLNVCFEQNNRIEINKILEYGLKMNKIVFDTIKEKVNSKIHDIKIEKTGEVLVNNFCYGSVIVITDVIDPKIFYNKTTKDLIEDIRTMNKSFKFSNTLDYFSEIEDEIITDSEGRIIKKHSGNECEYKIYKEFKNDKTLPLPRYVDSYKDVDRFYKYEGTVVKNNLTDEQIIKIVEFLVKFKNLSKQKFNGEVYAQGKLDLCDFYFDDNGNLSQVVNFENAYVGDEYDDIILFLIKHSGIFNIIFNEIDRKRILEKIDLIINSYTNDEKEKILIVDKILPYINKKIENIDKTNKSNIYIYRKFSNAQSFICFFINDIKESLKEKVSE